MMSMLSLEQAADLAIAIAYFFIPAEMFIYIFKRRSMWVFGRRVWLVSVLFITFIMACGSTHLLHVLNVPFWLNLMVKVFCAIVSVITAIVLCWVVPEALSLPQYVSDITVENKLMRDFRAVTNTIRRVLREDAIIENARSKLRRLLPPNTLVDISKEPPAELCGTRELLTLPIAGNLGMHLRRSKLSEAQVTWLHDVCVQMKLALEQAAALSRTAPSTPPRSRAVPVGHLHNHMNSSSSKGDALDETPLIADPSLRSIHSSLMDQDSSKGGTLTEATVVAERPIGATLMHPLAGVAGAAAGGMDLTTGVDMMNGGGVAVAAASAAAYERAMTAELEVARLRVRCSGILSRIQAVAEVLQTTELRADQEKCLRMIMDACNVDLMQQPESNSHASISSTARIPAETN